MIVSVLPRSFLDGVLMMFGRSLGDLFVVLRSCLGGVSVML